MSPRRPPLEEVGEDPDPRFSFANERTFLAWNRTAVALIAAGLGVSRLLPGDDHEALRAVAGIALIVLGGLLAFASYGQWERSERALRLAQSLPRPWLSRVLAVGVAAAAVVAVVLATGNGSS